MIKAYRVMLLPNNKQSTRLQETSDAARYAYNWTVGKQMKAFEETGKYIPEKEIRKMFTKHKKDESWLHEISNNATKQAIKDACDAFWRFVKEKKKPNYKPYSSKKIRWAAEKGITLGRYEMRHHPKFKKKGKAQPKFYADSVKINFTNTHVVLEKIATSKRRNRTIQNKIKLAETNRIPLGVKYTNPRITFDGLNWWISVGVDVSPLAVKPAGNGLGIDVGINKLAVESNGNEHRNINKDEKVRKLKKRQRRLQRGISRKYNKNKEGECYKKTRNIIKSENKLLKLHLRLTGIRHNHVHQVTSGIVKQKPSFIVVEDLNVQGMMKNKHLSKAIQEQCLYEFSRQLKYKSKYHGIEFKKANRMYPSSKLCSMCGSIKKDLKLSERIYRCDCGNVLDRDLNAAINLMKYAI